MDDVIIVMTINSWWDISIIDSVLLVINDSLHIQMKLNIEMFNEYTYAINSIYSDFIITHLMEGE